MIKVLETQGTPNPDSLKFITDSPLAKGSAKSFEDAKAGESDPLANDIFGLGPVASVFILDRFVTVTKFPSAEWEDLPEKISQAIETKAVAIEQSNPSGEGTNGSSDESIVDQINRVLDENIRPALAADGGGLEVMGYNDFTLSVHYQGACGSCPSATAGTLYSIQNLLQSMVDERIQVVPV